MSNLAFERPAAQRWPMTTEAWRELADELGRLRTARRLDLLTSVFDAAEQVDEPTRAVIGRQTTVLEEGDESVTYALVYPGDGDPAKGRISADSPMGSAILGACTGDSVEVIAPAGRRVITIVAVEQGNVCSAP